MSLADKRRCGNKLVLVVRTPEFLLRAFLLRKSVHPRFVCNEAHKNQEGLRDVMSTEVCARVPCEWSCGSTPGHTAGSRMYPAPGLATLEEIEITTASLPPTQAPNLCVRGSVSCCTWSTS